MAIAERNIPDVCVIVPTFNRAQYLGEALDSVLGQTRPPADIIVVDDGSTDKTSEVAKSFGDRIRYVRKENGGKSAAVNLALRLSQAHYVIIADDDDIMYPSGLAHLLAPLERDGRLDFSNGGFPFFATFRSRPDRSSSAADYEGRDRPPFRGTADKLFDAPQCDAHSPSVLSSTGRP